MIHQGPPRRGFTLIELLIVVGMVPILTYGMVALLGQLNESRARVESRLNAEESASRALSVWRRDVTLASPRVEIGASRDAMTLARYDERGYPVSVTYVLTNAGDLLRLTDRNEGEPRHERKMLAGGVSGLRFRSVNAGFQVEWTMVHDDGVVTWRRPQSAFATPLLSSQAPARVEVRQ